MKKIIDIYISESRFALDEDAAERLEAYLSAFRKKLQGEPQADEIIADVQSRIAELLSENICYPNQVVSLPTIEELIQQLGMPDGSAFEEKAETSDRKEYNSDTENRPKRRLYRVIEQKRLGGVCTGLAEYFDISTSLVRILFLIALVLGSFGFWLYLILWLALPSKPKANQSLDNQRSNRLFRDPYSRKIAGVCNGLARYLDIDVALIYLLFIGGLFFGGTSIIIYIILWIALPYPHTPAEKCDFFHLAPTAENLANFSK